MPSVDSEMVERLRPSYDKLVSKQVSAAWNDALGSERARLEAAEHVCAFVPFTPATVKAWPSAAALHGAATETNPNEGKTSFCPGCGAVR